jgi:MoxR-like ATPase
MTTRTETAPALSESAEQRLPAGDHTRAAETPREATRDDRTDAQAFHEAARRIRDELGKRIIGQEQVVELLLVALFARGHGLFIGVPGLAKTLLISTLAETLGLAFSRIQFTPDLMPADITGTDILEEDATTSRRFFRFVKGPIFCNLLLADEINRTPPKTQAALLQAMQEYEVTAGGTTYPLDPPFLVFATQNPIEQEGTYPLPEAQLDRFMLNIRVQYPTEADEVEIVKRTTTRYEPAIAEVLTPAEIARFQNLVLRVPVADSVIRYAVDVVRRSRPENPSAPPFVKDYLSWGAGPRASQHLVLAAKARALLVGEYAASEEDIRALAYPVLGHRLIANFHAEAERVDVADIVARVLDDAQPR